MSKFLLDEPCETGGQSQTQRTNLIISFIVRFIVISIRFSIQYFIVKRKLIIGFPVRATTAVQMRDKIKTKDKGLPALQRTTGASLQLFKPPVKDEQWISPNRMASYCVSEATTTYPEIPVPAMKPDYNLQPVP